MVRRQAAKRQPPQSNYQFNGSILRDAAKRPLLKDEEPHGEERVFARLEPWPRLPAGKRLAVPNRSPAMPVTRFERAGRHPPGG
jgi:hypothetical protein